MIRQTWFPTRIKMANEIWWNIKAFFVFVLISSANWYLKPVPLTCTVAKTYQHTEAEKNGQYFADRILKSIFCDENFGIWFEVLLKSVHSDIIDNSQHWFRKWLGHRATSHYYHITNGHIYANGHMHHLFLTRTTRTPAFWGYPPPPHDYPHYWIMLGPKSKQDRMTLNI